MDFDFLAVAQLELEESFDYYEARREGLGTEFVREVYRAIQRILKHPRAWAKLSERTRRCRTSRFPYGIIYEVRDEENVILIVAIAHLSRKPGYWQDRLKEL